MAIGNLKAAAPSGVHFNVFPNLTFTQFEASRIFPTLQNTYKLGEYEASLLQDGVNLPQSILSWKLSVRLIPANVTILSDFFKQQQGPLTPFYWYDPFDTLGEPIRSNYDPTGGNEVGRHTVVFANPTWSQTLTIGRSNISFSLDEIA